MPEQQIVKQEQTPEGLVAQWERAFDPASFTMQTSLPVTTPKERGDVLNILEGECIKASDVINNTFEFTDYIAHPVTLVNEETGETADAIRLILLGPDTPPISFCSLGVLKSLQRIVWQRGQQPPFDPPARVKLKQVSTRGARRTFKLVPAEE